MPTKTFMKPCSNCQKMTMHTRPETSHLLHLALTLVTAGVWIFVWPIIAWRNRRKNQCTVCGLDTGL